MGRLGQVGWGMALAFVCFAIADTQKVVRNACPEEFSCPVEELNGNGLMLSFIGYVLIFVAAVNLMKCFGRPDK